LDNANKILEALGGELDRSLGSIDAFVVGLVSYARNSNQTWPFVTMPDFAVQAAKTRSLSKSSLLYLYLVVTDDERERWEDYSLKNDGWVDEVLEAQKNYPNYHGVLMSEFEPSRSIYNNYGVVKNGTGPYLPIWQSTPVVPVWAP